MAFAIFCHLRSFQGQLLHKASQLVHASREENTRQDYDYDYDYDYIMTMMTIACLVLSCLLLCVVVWSGFYFFIALLIYLPHKLDL